MELEDIARLREAGLVLDEKFRVIDAGRIQCCVGLLATFYFLDGNTPEVRETVAKALDRYSGAAGDKLVWGADPFTGTPKRIAGTDIANPRSWMNRIGPKEDMEIVLHGAKDKRDASPYTVEALVHARLPTDLSYFSFALPFEWLSSQPVRSFVQLVLDMCEILAPRHGYAGLGVVPHVDLSRDSAEFAPILALASRFSGLEVDLPWSHVLYLEQEDRIKGVNWITILGDSMVERLGGLDALRAALGPGIDVHPFKQGIAIQAGPRPLFGDVNRQEPMPLHRRVAQVLKPIRIESVRALSTPFGSIATARRVARALRLNWQYKSGDSRREMPAIHPEAPRRVPIRLRSAIHIATSQVGSRFQLQWTPLTNIMVRRDSLPPLWAATPIALPSVRQASFDKEDAM